jgi:hypothetical protein
MSYTDANRPNGSQSEIPTLTITPTDITVDGYQRYGIVRSTGELRVINKPHKFATLQHVLQEFATQGCHSFIDVGCSAGLTSLLALKSGFTTIGCLDHDCEYIEQLNVILTVLTPSAQMTARVYSFGDQIESLIGVSSADVVFCGALIHWIYCLTANYHKFDPIIEYLVKYTSKYLMIEWVDPNDDAIQHFGHLNRSAVPGSEPYTTENFERALRKYGTIINTIPFDGPNRILYLVTV